MDTNITENNLPDYKLAAREAAALMEANKISMEITGATAKIRRAEDKDGRDWPHVEFSIEFVNGKTGARQEFTYSYGLGFIDWKKALAYAAIKVGRHSSTYVYIEAMGKDPSRLSSQGQIDAATFCIGFFTAKAKSDAASIFASICREGEDAATQTFTDWADAFGYDSDSRKAEGIYRECQQNYNKVNRLVNRAVIKEFAELAARF